MTKRLPRKRWFALILLFLVLILFYRSDWLGRLVYPVKYKQEIKLNAEKYGVDPYLVAAVIRVESNYKHDTVSPKGAVGIMQLMPDTAEWIFQREGLKTLTAANLTDPEINIHIGTLYMSMLYQQFKNDPVLVVASYNAGPGNVNKWLSNQVWDGTKETTDQIPFKETRNYVNKVLYYHNKYKSIYDEGF